MPELLCTVNNTFLVKPLGLIITPDISLDFFDADQRFPFTCEVLLRRPEREDDFVTAQFFLPHCQPLEVQLAFLKTRCCSCVLLKMAREDCPPGTQISRCS